MKYGDLYKIIEFNEDVIKKNRYDNFKNEFNNRK